MSISVEIQAAIRGFNDIVLGGVPILLKQNKTAFLSFMCMAAAIDALAGYRYATDNVGQRFGSFIKEYFPPRYTAYAENLYKLRCRLLHNFSPAYFTLAHSSPASHLGRSQIGDTILSDDMFFADLKEAALKFFDEVQKDSSRQSAMDARLSNVAKG